MDLREKKTRRSIKNAFLQLRSHKSLERITVKELSELAEISKATFYLHYKDIYDLSEQLQQEVIRDILTSVIQPGLSLFDMGGLAHTLFDAFHAHQSLIDILFSSSQAAVLPVSIERRFQEYAFSENPALRSDVRFRVLLSYQIHGSYAAYTENHLLFGDEEVLSVLDEYCHRAYL